MHPSAVHALRVVDFGLGLPAALIAKLFAELGARVSRIEPAGGDPFYDVYPAYRAWRRRAILEVPERAAELLDAADVCIVGGEDFPGTAHEPDALELSRRHPRLIVVRIVGYPGVESSDAAPAARPAVDLLVQARTGVVFEQFSRRPVAASFPLAGYGAALQGLIGAWVALVERERSGRGQVVTVSLAGGAAMFWGPFWMKAERADAAFAGITPRDVRQLVLRCAQGDYLHLTLGVPGALAKVYGVLGIPDPVDAADRGMPDPARGPDNFYGNVDLLNAHARRHERGALLQALRDAGIPAEAVLPPGGCWNEAQTRINGIIETDASGWRSVGNPLRIATLADPVPPRAGPVSAGAPPLAGLRVIDFGVFVAGPYASKLLADYGADVIQVEPPSGRATLSGERTIISANHGKRSICIDAKTPAGRRLVAMLCADADIVLHNFRPGVAQRLGLDQAALRLLNPGLVTLETSAYGATGPKAPAPGFDMVMQAHCGLEHRGAGAGNPPLCCRAPIVDFATGAVGAIGLLTGLYERLKSGRGVAVETNLLNVGTHMMLEVVRSPSGAQLGAPALDRHQTGVHPAESLYATGDGWIAVAARSNGMAAALAETLGLVLPAQRATWGDPERERIAARLASWPTAAALARLGAAGIWAEPCVPDAWQNEPTSNGLMRTLHDAVYGEVVHCIGPLVEFSRSRTEPAARLSTTPGQDSEAVLAELGACPA